MVIDIKMQLISDVIFGNGINIPGGEDISVLCDAYGFPYYKGSTFKGIFREELIRYLLWKETCSNSIEEIEKKVDGLLGKSGDTDLENKHKLTFSDFTLSDVVRERILDELGMDNPMLVLDILSHLRTFTKLNEEEMAEEGSLRSCRCVNKNLIFYSKVNCAKEDQEMIQNVLQLIKWIGSMRNRGFGKVKISIIE